jgi:hypothetical protein
MSEQRNDMQKQDGVSESRRHFLKTTAAAAGVAALGASAAGSAQNGRMPKPGVSVMPRKQVGADDPIRMAIIGTGGMGTGHMHGIMGQAKEGHENVEIVALCDVCGPSRLDPAHQACESTQGMKVDRYGDYTKLLARDDIHAVRDRFARALARADGDRRDDAPRRTCTARSR